MLQLSLAGNHKAEVGHDVLTKRGAFAGVIVQNLETGKSRVYFNSSCTKGSKRVFNSAFHALEYIYQRRLSKGWSV